MEEFIVVPGIAVGFMGVLALSAWLFKRAEDRQEAADRVTRYMHERRERGLKDDEPETIRLVQVFPPPGE